MELSQLIDRKNDLERRKERLLGKMEAARSALEDIDSKLKEMNIDPDRLEEEINRLKAERDRAIQEYLTALATAEQIIGRVEERVNNL